MSTIDMYRHAAQATTEQGLGEAGELMEETEEPEEIEMPEPEEVRAGSEVVLRRLLTRTEPHTD